MIYDVIIVGAGPAGGYLAYKLASRGLSVLILEKEVLPREKCCAGGITRKALEILDFEIKEVIEDSIKGYIASLEGKNKIERSFTKPVFETVRRSEFDYFLAKKALEKGAKIEEEKRVLGVEANDSLNRVYTGKENFVARIVVGADGARSRVAQSVGLRKGADFNIGIEAEIPVSLPNPYQVLIHLDFGSVPQGYGFVFPKRDCLSCGLFTIKSRVKHLKYYFYRYLEGKGFYNPQIRIRGGFIPKGGTEEDLHQKGVLLVGDAAGLADPLTGEGIFFALKSSEIAAQEIERVFKGEIFDLSPYTLRVKREITKGLKYARKIASLFYSFPRLGYKLAFRRDITHLAFEKLTTGEIGYSELYKLIIEK